MALPRWPVRWAFVVVCGVGASSPPPPTRVCSDSAIHLETLSGTILFPTTLDDGRVACIWHVDPRLRLTAINFNTSVSELGPGDNVAFYTSIQDARRGAAVGSFTGERLPAGSARRREQSIPELMTLTSSDEAVIVMHPAAPSSHPHLRIDYSCEEVSGMGSLNLRLSSSWFAIFLVVWGICTCMSFSGACTRMRNRYSASRRRRHLLLDPEGEVLTRATSAVRGHMVLRRFFGPNSRAAAADRLEQQREQALSKLPLRQWPSRGQMASAASREEDDQLARKVDQLDEKFVRDDENDRSNSSSSSSACAGSSAGGAASAEGRFETASGDDGAGTTQRARADTNTDVNGGASGDIESGGASGDIESGDAGGNMESGERCGDEGESGIVAERGAIGGGGGRCEAAGAAAGTDAGTDAGADAGSPPEPPLPILEVAEEDFDGTDCCLCMETFEAGDRLRLLPCDHCKYRRASHLPCLALPPPAGPPPSPPLGPFLACSLAHRMVCAPSDPPARLLHGCRACGARSPAQTFTPRASISGSPPSGGYAARAPCARPTRSQAPGLQRRPLPAPRPPS